MEKSEFEFKLMIAAMVIVWGLCVVFAILGVTFACFLIWG